MKIITTSTLMALLALTSAFAQLTIENAFPDLGFNRPVDIQNAGDDSDRLFVVEQSGRILVFPNQSDASNPDVFLDIRSAVLNGGNEEGLLGLAFHPNYTNNGYFYVNHSAANPRRNVIARYSVSENDPNKADPESEFVVLEFLQPYSNHNGGQLAFGPEGYLYIATGDGGSGGDPQGNGQNRATLLGKILRIDVDNTGDGLNYAIPADNPYAGNEEGFREEIWAYGLRNPWRFSFDPVTGRLWTGDVGQNQYEEIDIIEKGGNYGWNIMEGMHCFSPPSGCDQTGLELPVVEYSHALGASVTGGHVYRGASAPELEGLYMYADFGSGRIWTLEYDGVTEPVNELLENTGQNISTFGVDEAGELYYATFGGSIYKFSSTGTSTGFVPAGIEGFHIDGVYPNPAEGNGTLTVEFSKDNAGPVSVLLYDALGRLHRRHEYTDSNAGTNAVAFNTGNVARGMYRLVVMQSSGMRASVPVHIR